MAGVRKLDACRIGGGSNLITVLSLGEQALTGVFPRSRDKPITSGPLDLVWCPDSGLLQLGHSYDAGEMYGENYGYRSGLNQMMVDHLSQKVGFLERRAGLAKGDTVLDIGSNDCTSLKAYRTPGLNRIGIDPTAGKFREYYDPDVQIVEDFFSAENYFSITNRKAKIITSIAMFYDLENPIGFAQEIAQALAADGVWHFEQSYMPAMLRLNSYDTICHEHLEYYSLEVVRRILKAANMKIIDVQMNAVNGGSFAVTAAHAEARTSVNHAVIDWLIGQEERMGLRTPRPYREFEERVFRHREDLRRLLQALTADGKTVLGYGASTKGNAVLQFCGIDAELLPAVAEVNPEKFGRVTPGSCIPIVSEAEAKAMRPDYFLVLPWHFKDGIIRREREWIAAGGKMIFPFPEIEIV